ncbi:hypothetical protein KA005_58040 [bacterium]|nr:hypothetical protein [bacterium]
MSKKLNLSSPIELIAEAGVNNPNLGWLSFVLTDSEPNNNKQGIRKEAFASLIVSGQLMPVKMAKGEIAADHTGAEPLGAIANLSEEDDKVLGKAAIWKSDRAEAYEILTAMSAANELPRISWEIAYTESELDDDGVEWISDPMLKGATIVGNPAYGDRTPILSVASNNTSEDESDDEDLEEEEPEDETSEEDDTEDGESEKDTKRIEELESKVEELQAYKDTIEQVATNAALLESRVAELTAAGVELTQEEIEAEKESWLKMSDEIFASMLNVLKKIKPKAANSARIPDVSGDSTESHVDIVRKGLRKMKEQSSLEETE